MVRCVRMDSRERVHICRWFTTCPTWYSNVNVSYLLSYAECYGDILCVLGKSVMFSVLNCKFNIIRLGVKVIREKPSIRGIRKNKSPTFAVFSSNKKHANNFWIMDYSKNIHDLPTLVSSYRNTKVRLEWPPTHYPTLHIVTHEVYIPLQSGYLNTLPEQLPSQLYSRLSYDIFWPSL